MKDYSYARKFEELVFCLGREVPRGIQNHCLNKSRETRDCRCSIFEIWNLLIITHSYWVPSFLSTLISLSLPSLPLFLYLTPFLPDSTICSHFVFSTSPPVLVALYPSLSHLLHLQSIPPCMDPTITCQFLLHPFPAALLPTISFPLELWRVLTPNGSLHPQMPPWVHSEV